MINWNGISLMIDNAATDAAEVAKQKKTTIYVVAAIIVVGIILLIKGK